MSCAPEARASLCARDSRSSRRRSSRPARKAGRTPPRHPFFDACATVKSRTKRLCACLRAALPLLKARLLVLQRRADSAQAAPASFNPTTTCCSICEGAEGGARAALAERVRERYSAALIDEFQDTDPFSTASSGGFTRGTSLPVFLSAIPSSRSTAFAARTCLPISSARATRGMRIRSTSTGAPRRRCSRR